MSLKKYAALLPGSYHYLSACCFSIFNRPIEAASIFRAALQELHDEEADHDKRMHLARQFREALLRAGIFGGMSRAINSLEELHKMMPEELQEHEAVSSVMSEQLLSSGLACMKEVYGSSEGERVNDSLKELSPRLGYYSTALVYGGIYADCQALTIKDSCMLMFLCNMAVDTPKQAKGHIMTSKRHGATTEELLNLGMMCKSISALYNVQLSSWVEIMEAVERNMD